MRLLRVELLRLRSRRVTKLLGLALLAIVLITFISTSADGGSESLTPHQVSLVLAGTSMIPISAMWLLGASFVGGDWHTGFMVTTLTWEPRRVRLLLTKAGVIVVTALLVTVVFSFLIGLAIIAEAGSPARWVGASVETVARASWLAVLAALIGFGVAAGARSTAAALGAGIGYLLGVEVAMSALAPGLVKWLLIRNSVAFLLAEETIILPGRSPFEAGIILTMYGVIALVAGTVLFSTRDVT